MENNVVILEEKVVTWRKKVVIWGKQSSILDTVIIIWQQPIHIKPSPSLQLFNSSWPTPVVNLANIKFFSTAQQGDYLILMNDFDSSHFRSDFLGVSSNFELAIAGYIRGRSILGPGYVCNLLCFMFSTIQRVFYA